MANEERSPRANFIRALSVVRNATVGVVVGVVFTAAVFGFFVFLPGTVQPSAYYAVLAFTLASAIAILVTVVLTVRSAYRLLQE